LGDQIDIFGRGINEIEDKWDALIQYKYHVALENCSEADYWTEKLSDPFLAGCHPIYYGCPNIDDYFAPSSLTKIDINHPVKAVDMIQRCMENQTYEASKPIVWKAREKVLNQYNLFAVLNSHIIDFEQQIFKKDRPVQLKLKKESSDSNLIYKARTTIRAFIVGR